MKLEKFDLEKALNGTKVVTRDGREVTQLSKFNTYRKLCLYGVVDDEVECWTIDGQYTDNSSCSMDLFLESKVESVWVNVYSNIHSHTLTSEWFKTKEEAIEAIQEIPNIPYIKTIEITDEV